MRNFRVVGYSFPNGCCAAYYPETNPLVPLYARDPKSFTPSYKGIPIRLVRSTARRRERAGQASAPRPDGGEDADVAWQRKPEPGAAIGGKAFGAKAFGAKAFGVDAAAMRFDDGPADRQSHAHAGLLGREKAFEQPAGMFGGDAGTVVLHGAAQGRGVLCGGGDDDPAMVASRLRHRLHGVDGQIDDHLLELGAVAEARVQLPRRAGAGSLRRGIPSRGAGTEAPRE